MHRELKLPWDLPAKFPRKYLSEQFNPYSSSDVQSLLLQLSLNKPASFTEANQWFNLFNEASTAISEAQTILEIAIQYDTGNKFAEQKLIEFEEKVLSKLLESRGTLIDIYSASPWRYAMHADDRDRIIGDFANRKRYTNAEISNLQIEENQLIRKYRNFMSAAEVMYEGSLTPISVVVGKFSDNKEDVRKKSFFTYWEFIAANENKLQRYFDDIYCNRISQANAASTDDYMNLAFAELGRIDYGAAECAKFRAAILDIIVPIINELSVQQCKEMQCEKIEPWNVSIWSKLMPQNKPCEGNVSKLQTSFERMSRQINPAFADLFVEMRKRGLVDIEPRFKKAPGAFCVTLQERRIPFIFANFGGSFRDAITLAHEFGHAIHGHASSFIPNVLQRNPGLEFCEMASIGYEFLCSHFFSEFWPDKKDVIRAQGLQKFQSLSFWPFMAMIDGWQHAIYGNKLCSPKERNSIWLQLSRQFRPHIDWSSCPQFEELGWFSRPHIFTSPFYYIDYGIAQLGAVQLWQESMQDFDGAVNKYIMALSLGAQRSLAELFTAAGATFSFGQEPLGRLANVLAVELENTLRKI